jgi:dihydroorotase
VENGRVYLPGGLRTIDLWIKDGKVAGHGGPHRAEEKIDARGMMVLPGAVDVHVHFRDPGFTYKENWESGSLSAAAGGVTTVIDQPNTNPRTFDAQAFSLKLEIARRHSVVDFCLNGGPGKIEDLLRLGASAIGEIFAYEHSDSDLKRILEKTAQLGALATLHAEDGGILREREEALRDRSDPEVHSLARPAEAEAMALHKALAASSHLHICHLSTGTGLEILREARSSGKRVSCEVAPHHLLFDLSDYREQGTFLKVNPPLRAEVNCLALWDGLCRGDIDILASDHAPHLPEEKKASVWEAPPGVPGTETMLPLMLMAVKKNMLTLERLVHAVSARPAEIFGLAMKGSLENGKDADLVLINPKNIVKIRADRLHSQAEWTPYEKREAIFPHVTMLRGEVVFDGDLEVRPGYGRFLPGALKAKDFIERASLS